MGLSTVVFDLDGVLLDSEQVWHEVRRGYTSAHGGRWTEDDQRAVMGDNSGQWAHHIRTVCGVERREREIIAGVVDLLIGRYREHLPLIEGAREAVAGLARAHRLGLASSAPPEVIRFVLHQAGFAGLFDAWLSSDDVEAGKPAPDGYIAVCDRLGAERARTVAVEDSSNGLFAAHNAGLKVIAVPNTRFPPGPDALEVADLVVAAIADLTPAVVASLTEQ